MIASRARSWRVRIFEAEDLEAAYRLDQSCYPPGIAYSRFALREFLSAPGSRAWVVEGESGSLTGLVIVRHMRGGRGHVITLDVAAARRRQGLGSQLLSTAEAWLHEQGVRRVRLETAVGNEAAVGFWQNAGYRVVGTLRRYYLDRDDAYRMEKGLV